MKPTSTDPALAGLLGQRVSVLLAIGDRRTAVQGLLIAVTSDMLKLRSQASRTFGRETWLMRQNVVAVQAIDQEPVGGV